VSAADTALYVAKGVDALRRGKQSVQICAAERAEGWQVIVVVEYKTDCGGGRVWEKTMTDLAKVKEALQILGIEL
jgi:hypothetical protein